MHGDKDPLHGVTLEMMLTRLVAHYGCPGSHLKKRFIKSEAGTVMTSYEFESVFNESHGWEEMGNIMNLNCFKFNPSIKSSLYFLRRTPWAREQIEALYVGMPK